MKLTAKEYLMQIEKLDTCINQRQVECDELREMMHSVGAISYDEKVQSSPRADALERRVVKYVEMEQKINNMIDEFVDLKHEIINQIQLLSDEKHISVLFKRYVQYKSFEQIAVEMNYSYQYVRELHGYALEEFESSYKNLHPNVL